MLMRHSESIYRMRHLLSKSCHTYKALLSSAQSI